MKLSFGDLRTLIRESLEEQDLDERALTTKDAGDDLALMIDAQHDRLDIVLYRQKEMHQEIAEGYGPKSLAKNVVAVLGAGQGDFDVPFFEVRYVAADKGWGPFVYDIALSLSPKGLMPDRMSVSTAAKRIWDHYQTRGDIETISLEDYNIKLHGDDVLDYAYRLKGPGPETKSLQSKHDPADSSNVSDAGRRFMTSRM